MNAQTSKALRAIVLGLALVAAVGGIYAVVSRKENGPITKSEIDAVCEKLLKGPNSSDAVDKVLSRSDRYPAMVLFFAALAAVRDDRLEDGGFLYYAAKQRTQFDKACFPPKSEGGDNPFTLLNGLSAQVDTSFNPTIMAQPTVFRKAVERIKVWSPKVAVDDVPGYEFSARVSEQEALAKTETFRRREVTSLSEQATLLSDDTYFDAFLVVQSFNLPIEELRPTKSEFDTAMAVMKRIVTEKGFTGFASYLGRQDRASDVSP